MWRVRTGSLAVHLPGPATPSPANGLSLCVCVCPCPAAPEASLCPQHRTGAPLGQSEELQSLSQCHPFLLHPGPASRPNGDGSQPCLTCDRAARGGRRWAACWGCVVLQVQPTLPLPPGPQDPGPAPRPAFLCPRSHGLAVLPRALARPCQRVSCRLTGRCSPGKAGGCLPLPTPPRPEMLEGLRCPPDLGVAEDQTAWPAEPGGRGSHVTLPGTPLGWSRAPSLVGQVRALPTAEWDCLAPHSLPSRRVPTTVAVSCTAS